MNCAQPVKPTRPDYVFFFFKNHPKHSTLSEAVLGSIPGCLDAGDRPAATAVNHPPRTAAPLL